MGSKLRVASYELREDLVERLRFSLLATRLSQLTKKFQRAFDAGIVF